MSFLITENKRNPFGNGFTFDELLKNMRRNEFP